MPNEVKFYSNWRIAPLHEVNTGRVYSQICGRKFFPWFRVEIQDRKSSDGSLNKHVIVHADHYAVKEWECTFCYSAEHYTDYEVLNDIMPRICGVYSGTKLFYD